MLIMAPANAATKTDGVKETVSTENQDVDNDGNDLAEDVPTKKPNTYIKLKSGEIIPVKGEAVRLRKNPGLNTKVLRLLNESDGDVVSYYDYDTVYEDGYNWAHVAYLSKNGSRYNIVGYIATDYLY